MTLSPYTQNTALIITNSGLNLFHLYPHPFLSLQALNYLEANPRHHIITSIITLVSMSKKGEGFFLKYPHKYIIIFTPKN